VFDRPQTSLQQAGHSYCIYLLLLSLLAFLAFWVITHACTKLRVSTTLCRLVGQHDLLSSIYWKWKLPYSKLTVNISNISHYLGLLSYSQVCPCGVHSHCYSAHASFLNHLLTQGCHMGPDLSGILAPGENSLVAYFFLGNVQSSVNVHTFKVSSSLVC
jgi:hypothetical protein